MTAVALLSDIHGNLPALEAVVADIRRQRPDAVYVLGDMVNGCPWSGEVVDLIVSHGWPMLLGNHDDAVLQLDTPRMEPRYAHRRPYAALWWTREHLDPRHLTVLDRLPQQVTLTLPAAPSVCLVHGLPGDFSQGFRPDAAEEWAVGRLAQVAEKTVGAGHTHLPMIRPFGAWLVVNPGSVGVPYDGDVRAGYAWLEWTGERWLASIRRLDYDLQAVEAGFRDSGLLVEGGVMARMFLRSILTGLPWVADYAWWLRKQPPELLDDADEAEELYRSSHGPGRWAFPVV